MPEIEYREDVRINGRLFEMRRAKKAHKCEDCGTPIGIGEFYYNVIRCIGGNAIQYPGSIHQKCLGSFIEVSKK